MTERQWPKVEELRTLLRPKPFVLDPVDRRLSRCHTIADLRAAARRRAPRAVFDYTDGAADQEVSLRRAREAFGRVEFLPRIFQDVSTIDTSTEILGARAEYPFAFAPTGFTRMMHTEGEPAVARVAEAGGIPYALSTVGTTSIEDLAAAVPKARTWFQLYLWKDRVASGELVARAEAAGYEALMLTVDVAVAGHRVRDSHNGLSLPPALTLKTFLEGSLHPGWWFDLISTRPLEFATMRYWEGTVAELINHMFDPALTYDDVAWLRSVWPRTLVVKGIQSVTDAVRMADLGVDAIVVSNHGGRQLDRATTPLELLPEVLAAVGDRTEVHVDTGVTSGADIVAAVAMGAKAVLVGRAYLYGLMAGGQRGVERAFDILTAEIRRAMALLGARSVAELTPDLVRLRT